MNIVCEWDVQHAVSARDRLRVLQDRATALMMDLRHEAVEHNDLNDAAEAIEETVLPNVVEALKETEGALDDWQNSFAGG